MSNFLRNLLKILSNLFKKQSKANLDTKEPSIQSPFKPEDFTTSGAPEKIMEDIEHVVVVMMENRSFDNVLGWLYEENEINGLNYIPEKWNGKKHLFDGLFKSTANNYTNSYKKDGQVKFSTPPLEGASTNQRKRVDYFNSPPKDPWETFEHVTNQLFGEGQDGYTISPWTKPRMDGFLQSYSTKFDDPVSKENVVKQIMEGYSPRSVGNRNGIMPVLNNLARHYATSDHWYCSVPSQTNPNRAWMACGTSEGQVNNEGKMDQGIFSSKSIWEKINDKLTWRIYYEEDYFPITIDSPIPEHKPIVTKGTGPWTQNAFPWLKGIKPKKNVKEIQAFHLDARTGNLPQFSFIEPSWTLEGEKIAKDLPKLPVTEGLQGNECHPPGDVRPGEQFIGTLYNSLIANKKSWDKTLFIITFDEHGGTFDHIPPPPAPVDKRHESGKFQFNRYGVRVPTIFISPQIRPKTIFRGPATPNWDQTKPIVPQLDHTSIPATLLKWARQITPYGLYARTDVAPTFESVLNLPDTIGKRYDSRIGAANPSANGKPLTFGDKFYLKLKHGEYEYYLSYTDPKRGDNPKHPLEKTYYALASYHKDKRKKAWFTFPNLSPDQKKVINKQPITHGSMLYITSEAAPDGRPFLTVDYDDAYYDKDNKNSMNQWVIKLKNANPGDLGQNIYDGDEIYLENRDNVALKDWLPGKLIVNYSHIKDNLYTTTTKDKGYTDSSKGIITIEKA